MQTSFKPPRFILLFCNGHRDRCMHISNLLNKVIRRWQLPEELPDSPLVQPWLHKRLPCETVSRGDHGANGDRRKTATASIPAASAVRAETGAVRAHQRRR